MSSLKKILIPAAALATIRYMVKNDVPGQCKKKGIILTTCFLL